MRYMEFQEELWSLFQQGIFLIKGRSTKFDIVYKVVSKGGQLYFCKVGGQNSKIKDKEEEYHRDMTMEVFGRDKNNFVENYLEITDIRVDSKASVRTKSNGGTITYMRNGKKEKYIIHPIHGADIVVKFFREVVGLPVEFIDRAEMERAKFQGEEFNPFTDIDQVQYKRVQKLCKICNTIAWITSLWFLWFPTPYFFLLIVNIMLPLIGFFIYMKYNTFVELDEYKHRKGASVGYSILVPSGVVAFRALMDFNIVYSFKLWMIISLISLVLVALVLVRTKEYRVKKLVIIELAMFIFVYTYGTFIHGNCYLGESNFYEYSVEVLETRKTKDSDPSYYLTLEPWGPYREVREVEVTEETYNRRKAGMNIPIFLIDGYFGVPWYLVDDLYFTY